MAATSESLSEAWNIAGSERGAAGLLRFSTAGSVDDGKSTLIGRLLYDSQSVYDDQLSSLRRSRINRSTGPLDFSLLTDGLRAEREQGITIDVAYRYFSTPRRKFIIADTPGHLQYTRNMVTGASMADATVVLIDGTKGLLQQSRRHIYIASLLGVQNVIAAVNKMDLVGYSEEVFQEIASEFRDFAEQLEIQNIWAVPVSALEGDNVVRRSGRMPWFDGPTLLEYLETVPANESADSAPVRFPVQYVIRPDAKFRGFAGQLASGTLRRGSRVIALPSGIQTRIRSIASFDGEREDSRAGDSITVVLEDEIDLSRGDLLASATNPPTVSRAFRSILVWMHSDPLDSAQTYLLKQTARTVRSRVEIVHRIEIDTLQRVSAASLQMNDIALVEVRTAQPLFFDTYHENRTMGSFILIDPRTNATVGAGIIDGASDSGGSRGALASRLRMDGVTPRERFLRFGHGPAVVWLPRLQVAQLVERALFDEGWNVCLVESGEFKPQEAVALAKAFHRAGIVVLFVARDLPLERIQAVTGTLLRFEAARSGTAADTNADAARVVKELRRWRDQDPTWENGNESDTRRRSRK